MSYSLSRIKTHGMLAAATALFFVLAAYFAPYSSGWERLSVASAWSCMVLLVSALLIGPIRRMERSPYRINVYTRRDVGIWAALHGLFHFVAGNFVAMNQSYVGEFVNQAFRSPGVPVREKLFSGGSIAGMVIALIFLLLLAISSDRAMRRLGAKKWKTMQRSAHIALWVTVLHGAAFQVLEARYLPMIVMGAMVATLVGFQLRARRHPKN